jgi:hypothetical protein
VCFLLQFSGQDGRLLLPRPAHPRAREILASDGKQAAIEYLARERVKLSSGCFNKKLAYQTKPGRKVEVYAMTEKKIFWDQSRAYRIEALADALLVKAGQLALF